jgi:hypothetical protein
MIIKILANLIENEKEFMSFLLYWKEAIEEVVGTEEEIEFLKNDFIPTIIKREEKLKREIKIKDIKERFSVGTLFKALYDDLIPYKFDATKAKFEIVEIKEDFFVIELRDSCEKIKEPVLIKYFMEKYENSRIKVIDKKEK